MIASAVVASVTAGVYTLIVPIGFLLLVLAYGVYVSRRGL
jgi:hypothetical protein